MRFQSHLRWAIGAVVLLPAVACSGPKVVHTAAPKHSAKSTPSSSAAPRPRPRPKPGPTRYRAVRHMVTKITGNPLTGLSPIPKGRVIAVKMDDTSAGRPQVNIDSADIVYVEQVEGGLTRLVAVYAGHHPSAVGPVRSVRLGDPLLLAPYGGVALAYSGGASGVVSAVRQTHIVDGSQPVHGGPYSRSGAKPAPYNLMVNLASLDGVLRTGARVRDVGFRWARQARGLASAPAVHGFTAPVGNTPVSFRWDSGRRRWDRQIDGQTVRQSNGAAVSSPNVIVQECKIVADARDVDVAGNPSADTKPVGSGKALIFRDGRMLHARWVRASPHAQTHYVSASGKDIPLHPGGAWVLLSPRGAVVKTS